MDRPGRFRLSLHMRWAGAFFPVGPRSGGQVRCCGGAAEQEREETGESRDTRETGETGETAMASAAS
ncbi:hypothetical protein [Paenibacillus sp. FSL H7-0756]|uniref:hypothetical protein n=1 Tax=Paenibacillus sp. FSL H7-0756 TaxID=2954738 RepID=UPI0030F8BBF9